MTTSRAREGTPSMAEETREGGAARITAGLPWIERSRQFFRDVMLEMKKVSWPTRSEVINTTIIVVVTVFFFAFFLFGTDIVLSYLIRGIEWGAAKIFG
jgi:preprotein translocase subunit SecE